MFKGGDQIKVKTDRSFDDVLDIVEDIVSDLGPVHMSSSGRFSIDEGRHSGGFTQVRYKGDVRERRGGDGFIIDLDFEVGPTTTCLVLGIIAFFICQPAALIFLIPLMAKSDVERAANRALDDIEDELCR